MEKEEAALFYRLIWGLQSYVGRQRGLLPDTTSAEAFAALPKDDKYRTREALWKEPDLIDAYVRDNPDKLPADELEIVQKWKRFVAGDFYVFRFLKNHAILLGGSRAYGVLGLSESFEDLFSLGPMPVMVRTVLLPFKSRIVYDGWLATYPMTFGPGIRARLREEYATAKRRDQVVTTLEPELAQPAPTKASKPRADWQPVIDGIVNTTRKLKGGPALQSTALALLRASAELAQAAVSDPGDLDRLWQLRSQAQRALTKLQKELVYAAEDL